MKTIVSWSINLTYVLIGYLISVLFIAPVFAAQNELKGGSQYEYKMRLIIPQIIGFTWGRA